MERSNLFRNVWLFVGGAAWLFLMLSLASGAVAPALIRLAAPGS